MCIFVVKKGSNTGLRELQPLAIVTIFIQSFKGMYSYG